MKLNQIIKTGLLATSHYGRRFKQDKFPGVAVLCYHGVKPDDSIASPLPFDGLHVRAEELASHCRLIRRYCDPISMSDWHNAQLGKCKLPERPVLVTFDDGYRNIFTQALPVLEHYRIPAVVFVCSGPVQRRSLLWYDAAVRASNEHTAQKMKALPFDEWLSTLPNWSAPVGDSDPSAVLSAGEIAALARKPGIEIGAHTVDHPILARGNRLQQRDQIISNKEQLEKWIERPVIGFAYPNGRPGEDYTSETAEILREAGFAFGFTTRYGFAKPGESRLELSRFLMLSGISEAELAHRLSYSWPR